MRVRITLFSILALLSCGSPKDSPQTLSKQLIGRWIEAPGDSFSLGLADFTITDSTLSFAGQPDSLAARYEISPMDSITLFFTDADPVTFKVALSNNSDTLKLSASKTGRSMTFERARNN